MQKIYQQQGAPTGPENMRSENAYAGAPQEGMADELD